jgi:hypothetical protein
MQRLLLCLIMVLALFVKLKGQDTVITSSKLNTSFRNISFFSNNEYNSNFTKGYTVAGTWIKGGLFYMPINAIEIEGGFYYRHFFGEPQLEKYHPFYYRIKYSPYANFSITFGDIHSKTNHQLNDILYDSENNFLNPIEEGFLIEYSGSKQAVEAWVDWQKFIRINSPFREEFVAGISMNQQLFTIKNHKTFLAINGMAQHLGGEIDASPLPVSSIFNSRLMLTHSIENEHKTIANEFSVGYLAMFIDSKLPVVPVKNGYGYIFENSFIYKNLSVTTSYWHGNNFYSPLGNIIYSSFPENSVVYNQRNLLTLGIKWEKYIFSGASFCLKNDIYYEPRYKKPDFRSVLFLKIDLVTPWVKRNINNN